jgi:hypothetical protein
VGLKAHIGGDLEPSLSNCEHLLRPTQLRLHRSFRADLWSKKAPSEHLSDSAEYRERILGLVTSMERTRHLSSESFCCLLILGEFDVYGTTVNPEAFTYRALTLAPPTKIRLLCYGTSHIHLTEFRSQRKSLHPHQTSFLESNPTQMS